MKDFLHFLEVELRIGTGGEVEFIVEFISRLVCHFSGQAGTEVLNHSIIHVLKICIETTPQLKSQQIANTRAFEGFSYPFKTQPDLKM